MIDDIGWLVEIIVELSVLVGSSVAMKKKNQFKIQSKT
jgi:hypothetical protein